MPTKLELQQKNEALSTENVALRAQISALRTQLDALRTKHGKTPWAPADIFVKARELAKQGHKVLIKSGTLWVDGEERRA